MEHVSPSDSWDFSASTALAVTILPASDRLDTLPSSFTFKGERHIVEVVAADDDEGQSRT
jgi:hypothetical protein